MSQTVITTAFEQLKAQQAANGSVLTLDEFVFANVPGMNAVDPIDRGETLPDAAQIVYRQPVSKTGMVNNNAVVYSVVLGADTGDFEFNWIGLLHKASGTVAMIVHAPLQKKIKTAAGQQGNVLTRSFLMEYNGASQQTQIITPADTWQIDFTARLSGVDERIRRENIDMWGAAGFIDDGFKVEKTGSKFTVKAGAGYVAGIRAELIAAQEIYPALPSKVWCDVTWSGTLTSVWASECKITVADELADYTQGDDRHFVFAVASIDAAGKVTDLRPAGPQVARQSALDFLRKDKNLQDVKNKAEARKSLELGDSSTRNIGDGEGTVAAGDDRRIVQAIQSAGGTATGRIIFDGGVAVNDKKNPVGDGFDALIMSADKSGHNRWAFGGYGNSWSVYAYGDDGAFAGKLLDIDATTHDARFERQVIPGNYSNFDARYARKNQALLEENGWFFDADTGEIRQWGKVLTPTADIVYPVVFPIAFPTRCLSVQCTFGYDSARSDDGVTAQALYPTRTGFGANRQDIGSAVSLPYSYIFWEAKGK